MMAIILGILNFSIISFFCLHRKSTKTQIVDKKTTKNSEILPTIKGFKKELEKHRDKVNKLRRENERQSIESRKEGKERGRKLTINMQQVLREQHSMGNLMKTLMQKLENGIERLIDRLPKDEKIVEDLGKTIENSLEHVKADILSEIRNQDSRIAMIERAIAPKAAVLLEVKNLVKLFPGYHIHFRKLYKFIENCLSQVRNIAIARAYVHKSYYIKNKGLVNEIKSAGFDICIVDEEVDVKMLDDGFALENAVDELYLLSGDKSFSALLYYFISRKFMDSYVVYPKRSISLSKDLSDICTKVIHFDIENFSRRLPA